MMHAFLATSTVRWRQTFSFIAFCAKLAPAAIFQKSFFDLDLRFVPTRDGVRSLACHFFMLKVLCLLLLLPFRSVSAYPNPVSSVSVQTVTCVKFSSGFNCSVTVSFASCTTTTTLETVKGYFINLHSNLLTTTVFSGSNSYYWSSPTLPAYQPYTFTVICETENEITDQLLNSSVSNTYVVIPRPTMTCQANPCIWSSSNWSPSLPGASDVAQLSTNTLLSTNEQVYGLDSTAGSGLICNTPQNLTITVFQGIVLLSALASNSGPCFLIFDAGNDLTTASTSEGSVTFDSTYPNVWTVLQIPGALTPLSSTLTFSGPGFVLLSGNTTGPAASLTFGLQASVALLESVSLPDLPQLQGCILTMAYPSAGNLSVISTSTQPVQIPSGSSIQTPLIGGWIQFLNGTTRSTKVSLIDSSSLLLQASVSVTVETFASMSQSIDASQPGSTITGADISSNLTISNSLFWYCPFLSEVSSFSFIGNGSLSLPLNSVVRFISSCTVNDLCNGLTGSCSILKLNSWTFSIPSSSQLVIVGSIPFYFDSQGPVELMGVVNITDAPSPTTIFMLAALVMSPTSLFSVGSNVSIEISPSATANSPSPILCGNIIALDQTSSISAVGPVLLANQTNISVPFFMNFASFSTSNSAAPSITVLGTAVSFENLTLLTSGPLTLSNGSSLSVANLLGVGTINSNFSNNTLIVRNMLMICSTTQTFSLVGQGTLLFPALPIPISSQLVASCGCSSPSSSCDGNVLFQLSLSQGWSVVILETATLGVSNLAGQARFSISGQGLIALNGTLQVFSSIDISSRLLSSPGSSIVVGASSIFTVSSPTPNSQILSGLITSQTGFSCFQASGFVTLAPEALLQIPIAGSGVISLVDSFTFDSFCPSQLIEFDAFILNIQIPSQSFVRFRSFNLTGIPQSLQFSGSSSTSVVSLSNSLFCVSSMNLSGQGTLILTNASFNLTVTSACTSVLTIPSGWTTLIPTSSVLSVVFSPVSTMGIQGNGSMLIDGSLNLVGPITISSGLNLTGSGAVSLSSCQLQLAPSPGTSQVLSGVIETQDALSSVSVVSSVVSVTNEAMILAPAILSGGNVTIQNSSNETTSAYIQSVKGQLASSSLFLQNGSVLRVGNLNPYTYPSSFLVVSGTNCTILVLQSISCGIAFNGSGTVQLGSTSQAASAVQLTCSFSNLFSIPSSWAFLVPSSNFLNIPASIAVQGPGNLQLAGTLLISPSSSVTLSCGFETTSSSSMLITGSLTFSTTNGSPQVLSGAVSTIGRGSLVLGSSSVVLAGCQINGSVSLNGNASVTNSTLITSLIVTSQGSLTLTIGNESVLIIGSIQSSTSDFNLLTIIGLSSSSQLVIYSVSTCTPLAFIGQGTLLVNSSTSMVSIPSICALSFTLNGTVLSIPLGQSLNFVQTQIVLQGTGSLQVNGNLSLINSQLALQLPSIFASSSTIVLNTSSILSVTGAYFSSPTQFVFAGGVQFISSTSQLTTNAVGVDLTNSSTFAGSGTFLCGSATLSPIQVVPDFESVCVGVPPAGCSYSPSVASLVVGQNFNFGPTCLIPGTIPLFQVSPQPSSSSGIEFSTNTGTFSGNPLLSQNTSITYTVTPLSPAGVGSPFNFTIASVATWSCPAGFYCLAANTPVQCLAGFFCPANTDASTGILCSSGGSYCPAGSSTQQLCPAGNYCPDTANAVACPVGHFCPAGTVSPIACNLTQYCNSSSSQALPCPGSFYCVDASTIVPCPAGFFCSVGSINVTGQCNITSYCPQGSNVSQPCPAGNYCPTTTTILVCPAGSFCPSASTQASTCPEASYCPSGVSSPQACPATFYCATPSAVTQCPSGSYCPINSSQPTVCSYGEYCPASSSVPTTCPAGYCCPTPSSEIECAAGSYSGQGATSCTQCSPGFFSSSAGSASCTACAPGYTTGFYGASDPTDCQSSATVTSASSSNNELTQRLIVALPSSCGTVLLAILGILAYRFQVNRSWTRSLNYDIANRIRKVRRLAVGTLSEATALGYIAKMNELTAKMLNIWQDSSTIVKVSEMSPEERDQCVEAIDYAILANSEFEPLCGTACHHTLPDERIKIFFVRTRYLKDCLPNVTPFFVTYVFQPLEFGEKMDVLVRSAQEYCAKHFPRLLERNRAYASRGSVGTPAAGNVSGDHPESPRSALELQTISVAYSNDSTAAANHNSEPLSASSLGQTPMIPLRTSRYDQGSSNSLPNQAIGSGSAKGAGDSDDQREGFAT